MSDCHNVGACRFVFVLGKLCGTVLSMTDKNTHKNVNGKFKGKKSFLIPLNRRENYNMKINKRLGCEHMDRIFLAENRV